MKLDEYQEKAKKYDLGEQTGRLQDPAFME